MEINVNVNSSRFKKHNAFPKFFSHLCFSLQLLQILLPIYFLINEWNIVSSTGCHVEQNISAKHCPRFSLRMRYEISLGNPFWRNESIFVNSRRKVTSLLEIYRNIEYQFCNRRYTMRSVVRWNAMKQFIEFPIELKIGLVSRDIVEAVFLLMFIRPR